MVRSQSVTRNTVVVWIFLGVLGAALFVPAFVWEEGPRSLWRWSFEYGLALFAVAAAGRTRFGRLVRRIVIALYGILFAFLAYEHAFRSFYRGEPALFEDIRLVVNLVHFVSEMISARWVLVALAAIAGAAALVVLMDRAFATLQARAKSLPVRLLGLSALGFAIVGAVSVAAHGPIRVAGAKVADNVRASVAVHRRLGALGEAGRDDRYDDLMKVRLVKRPSFYFLVVEAYGAVLATWDMNDSYRALTERLRVRLETKGYRMRTAYSSAPVHGGRSWFSIATMQTGILIDQPESFKSFEAAASRVPTLNRFFRNQGYRTASLEPGTKERTGVGSIDLYAHDLRVDAPRLAYEGPRFGFGGIPDRYSLEQMRTRWLEPLGTPRYLFFMSVSTHYPWSADTVPPFDPPDPTWAPLPGEDAIGSELRRYYMKSVEYDLRAVVELLENDRSPDLVAIVLGDHQPRLESNAPGEVTFDTPVHVIARDPAFVDRFAKRGFQEGLYAEPGRSAPLTHEALFSMLVTELAAAYGSPETKAFAKYYRDGISLRGLNP